MIIIFIGPPYAGKATQTKLLGEKLGLPVFSMGEIIRNSYAAGNPKAKEGFEKYSMKGLHVPIALKFVLLREQMDKAEKGFVLDNFPANNEDVGAFKKYLAETKKQITKAFHLFISEEEMEKRMILRGRADDDPTIVRKRREIQDGDRQAVLTYFKEQRLLEEINGQGAIEDIQEEILKRLEKHD